MRIHVALLVIAALGACREARRELSTIALDDAAVAATVDGTALSTRGLLALAADRPSFVQFRAQITEGAIADQLVRAEAARRRVALTDADERELDQRMPTAAVLADQARQLGLAPGELTARRRDQMRCQLLLRALVDRAFPGELSPGEDALRAELARAPMAYADRPTATVRGLLVRAGDDPAELAAATDRAGRLLALAREAGTAAAFTRLAADNDALPPGAPDAALGSVALPDPFARPPALPALFGPALAADVARALFPGPTGGDTVIGPFRGPLGVFGLFVEQRQAPGAAPRFEQVRDRVLARWVGRALMTRGPQLIQRLRASATIELPQGAS